MTALCHRERESSTTTPLIKHNLVVIASVSHFVLVFGLHSVSICFEPPLNYATHSQRTTNTPTQRSEGNAGQGVQFGWVLLCKEMNRKLCCTHRRTKTTVFWTWLIERPTNQSIRGELDRCESVCKIIFTIIYFFAEQMKIFSVLKINQKTYVHNGQMLNYINLLFNSKKIIWPELQK